MMRFLVAGCGSIGIRHLGNLRKLAVGELLAFDPDPDRVDLASRKHGAIPCRSLDEGLQESDVVFVTSPTHLHIGQALQAAQSCRALFIEKPLSHVEDGLQELVDLVERRGVISMVGCNMRFHHGPRTIRRLLEDDAVGTVTSAMFEAGHYMPDWHPEDDYRTRYSARRAMGGGVILDGIHEIDYARWLLGEVVEVFCYGGRRGSLEIDVEDCADMLLLLGTGASAFVHVDYLQRAYSRTCKIIGGKGTITWSIGEPVRSYTAESRSWRSSDPPPDDSIDAMYVDELTHFLDCVRSGRQTMSSLADGAKVTRIALALRDSLDTRMPVSL